MAERFTKKVWHIAWGHPGPAAAVAILLGGLVFAARELAIHRIAGAANETIDEALKNGNLEWFIKGGVWIMFLALLIALAASAFWLGIRTGKHGYGKRYCLDAIDNLYAAGVGERNRFLPVIPNLNLAEETEKLEKWYDEVVQLLSYLSIPARSRFRTLNLFPPKYAPAQGKTNDQIRIETFWNEKLDRLQKIIASFKE